MVKKHLLTLGLALTLCVTGTMAIEPSGRADGRTLSTRASSEGILRYVPPRLEFRPDFTPAEFAAWQDSVRAAMSALMKHPSQMPAQKPVKVAEAQRHGYRIEKWESYPLAIAVVPFLLLIPDGVTPDNPAPAALCIPGFGQTKELLAGEPQGNYTLSMPLGEEPGRNAMAYRLVKNGIVALAVDNPACGELSDGGVNDYVDSSRFLLETGWSYLGLASWQDRVALEWLKEHPAVRADRIVVSGFSLGTEPLMVLGVLDPSVYAFVYNDFLCRTRERALVMNKRNNKGTRPYPNNIEHLIPGFLTRFDFPDLVAALAPRPLICTEGGMDRDFNLIKAAYRIAGAKDGTAALHHYARYADEGTRVYLDSLPDGLDRQDFFKLVNCDAPNHYFKGEIILPWLDSILK